MTATSSTLLHPTLAYHVANTLGWPHLRPLQSEALAPVGDGLDALLIAPTAGGKTEAVAFPLLSAMEEQGWTGLSVLYVCPLKALLNNLLPRLQTYATWLGRRVEVWHSDVSGSRRQSILQDPPDVLLTTPESLEAMLLSTRVDHRRLLRDLRAVVVDEVHAFAKDDRGWHLLCVLERLTRLAERPLQRLGLSATVGNPGELLSWLQGSGAGERPARVIAPEADAGSAPPAVELDHVGSVANAARVIAALHRGEKRLVFCDSRRMVEELGEALRELGVTVFLSHASLSADERRRAEEAFSQARDCVIVSTSTLELGIDVGDLDRVIQLNAPWSVASFLQRLGRTGRRPGISRNCLVLALSQDDLLSCAGLLHLWGTGYVEPVQPPPEPRHIVAQQLLALTLQEGQVGDELWPDWWNGLPLFREGSARPVLDHLIREGFLERDGGGLLIGPEAEQRFGRRHFTDLTAVFTAPPEFAVFHGNLEIGRTGPELLTSAVAGPRLLLLAGRTWKVDWTDWKRRRCFVEPVEGTGGEARWTSSTAGGTSFALARSMREVVLGADPPVRLTRRAVAALARAREENADTVHPDGTVIVRADGDLHWWTWAGYGANTTLKATLGPAADPAQRVDDLRVRLRGDLTAADWRAAVQGLDGALRLPEVDDRALNGLKFNAALPRDLAAATLAARLADFPSTAVVLAEPAHFLVR
ncbi:DEAD/DEAH box helicase [Planomonospora parontospora]|uniref:DEAD/DEAH box helicase n=1 Tax=Planomonospora parontospora TaxID=58119 RepID=UPI0016716D09|nr:DEAD/DEAH box helicase [Planomonospora parontospora]GGL56710.1 ATP-dependent helicase [Planomonospora parontospora subsp. antibiotica]GII19975.1 ATP-dependent helicase [Planomonospora parontospora subsp. antibiotica]